jgi:hypothetical protein
MRILAEILALMIALAIRHWKIVLAGIGGVLYMLLALHWLSAVSGHPVPYAGALIVASILFFTGVLR